MKQLLITTALILACGDPATPIDNETDASIPIVDASPGIPDATPRPPAVCIITLDCNGQTIPDEPKIPCSIRIEDGNGGLEYEGSVGVEKRGRSSQSFPKPQYAIELRIGEDLDNPQNLLGMGTEADWVLNGAYIDRALIRNPLLLGLFQSFGGTERYAAEIAYCELTLDGTPQGIYMLTERVKRDDDRVDLPEDLALDGSSFLIKQDSVGNGGIRPVGIAHGEWSLVYPNKLRATEAQVAGVVSWLDRWVAVVNGSDTTTDLFSLVDMGSAIDFVLLEEFAKNNDAFYLSMHVWKAPNGKLHFTPWDLDLSFGQPNYNNSESPEGWIAYRPALIRSMTSRPEFQTQLAARWLQLRAGVLSTPAVMERLEFHLETIAGHVDANFTLWPITEIQFLTDTLYPVESYEDEISKVKAWIPLRLAWMDANIGQYAE